MRSLWLILFVTNSLVYSQTELGSFPLKNKNVINLFEKPSSSSKIIYKIKKFPSFVVVLDTISNLKVSVMYRGLKGWVHLTDLSLNTETALYFTNKINEKRKNDSVEETALQSINEKKPVPEVPKAEVIPKKISPKSSPPIPKKITPKAQPNSKKDATIKDNRASTKIKEPKNNILTSVQFYLNIIFVFLIIGLVLLARQYFMVRKKYSPIIDIEKELEVLKKDLSSISLKIQESQDQYSTMTDELRQEYNQKKKIYDNLRNEIAVLDDSLEPMEFGIYKPKYDFGTPEEFKEKLNEIVQKQRQQVKDAVYSSVDVYVLDNKAKGTKMVRTYKKIAIRCFNSETDKIMKSVRWNNVKQCEEKIKKSHKVINDFLSVLKMYIEWSYVQLKIDELHIRYEYAEKLYEDREKRKEEAAKRREEERAQVEIEKAKLKAEKEEAMYQKALDEARKQLGLVSDEESRAMERKINELEIALKEAGEEKERAMSRAQQTKSGHVYIISNLGSFGEQVYKIGLTRRLEPMDRVKELGDASVPFSFDVHAMIYSEDAPALETQLHKIFDTNRVNQINRRKEFFKVSIDEIEKEVKKFDPSVDFISLSEAKEYYQTLNLLEQKLEKKQKKASSTFPNKI